MALGKTVGEINLMSSAELVRWMAYQRIEPFGFEIANYRAGVVAATVANCAPRGKGARVLKAADFYPTIGASALSPQLQEELKRRRAKKRGSK